MQLNTFQSQDVQPQQDVAGKQMSTLGDSMVKGVGQLKKVADEFVYDVAEANTKGNDNKLSEAYRKIMHDPQSGYMGKLGKDAVDSQGDTVKALDDAAKSIQDTIKDPLEQQMFQEAAYKRKNLALNQLDAHVMQQGKVYNAGEAKARLGNAVNDYVANYNIDPKAAKSFKDTALSEVEAYGKIMGFGSAQMKEARLEATTKMHMEVLGNYIAADKDGAAAAYFKANKGEISQDKHDDVLRVLNQGGTRDQSLQISLGLKGTLQENIAAVNKMYTDGKINASVRDAAITRVEHNWKLQQGAQAQFAKDTSVAAEQWLVNNPGKSLADMDPRLVKNLQNTGQWGTIVSFSKNNRYEQDPKAWGEVVGMTRSQLSEFTTDQFYNTYRGKLDNAHLERGMAMIADARGDLKGKHTQTFTNDERLKMSAKEAKIIPESGDSRRWSSDQQKNFGLLQMEVDRRAKVLENRLNRTLDGDELQGVINGVLMDKARVSGFWSDSEKPVTMLNNNDISNIYVMQGERKIKISEKDRNEYNGLATSEGLVMTPSLMYRMHKRKYLGN